MCFCIDDSSARQKSLTRPANKKLVIVYFIKILSRTYDLFHLKPINALQIDFLT